ncbi:hypothetical protein Cadr_000000308 [Camelus dromedarius]|uniref:Uncharacterized protein n=1 Tax=Camelus dromedarius TaxID=9838 RepID=A0A5N4EMU7_CAMDR|nr:hypothetical protein Cadr_000000308 [Camelus dromedarius]
MFVWQRQADAAVLQSRTLGLCQCACYAQTPQNPGTREVEQRAAKWFRRRLVTPSVPVRTAVRPMQRLQLMQRLKICSPFCCRAFQGPCFGHPASPEPVRVPGPQEWQKCGEGRSVEELRPRVGRPQDASFGSWDFILETVGELSGLASWEGPHQTPDDGKRVTRRDIWEDDCDFKTRQPEVQLWSLVGAEGESASHGHTHLGLARVYCKEWGQGHTPHQETRDRGRLSCRNSLTLCGDVCGFSLTLPLLQLDRVTQSAQRGWVWWVLGKLDLGDGADPVRLMWTLPAEDHCYFWGLGFQGRWGDSLAI